MNTLAVDDTLLNKAVQLGHHKSAHEAIIKALVHYIQDLKQQYVDGFHGNLPHRYVGLRLSPNPAYSLNSSKAYQ